MPFLMFGSKGKARRVPNGRCETRRCPECNKTCSFRECLVQTSYTAYHFLELWNSESTQFCCDGCGALMALEGTLPPELSAREQAQLEARAAKQAAAAKQEAERRQLARAREVDDELAAIKARLGLSDKK